MDKVDVPSDPSSISHKIDLIPQVKVGEVENPLVDLSPSPPTPLGQYFCADLDCNPDDCHVALSPQYLSFGPFDPPVFVMLCSPILDLTCDFHED